MTKRLPPRVSRGVAGPHELDPLQPHELLLLASAGPVETVVLDHLSRMNQGTLLREIHHHFYSCILDLNLMLKLENSNTESLTI